MSDGENNASRLRAVAATQIALGMLAALLGGASYRFDLVFGGKGLAGYLLIFCGLAFWVNLSPTVDKGRLSLVLLLLSATFPSSLGYVASDWASGSHFFFGSTAYDVELFSICISFVAIFAVAIAFALTGIRSKQKVCRLSSTATLILSPLAIMLTLNRLDLKVIRW